MKIELVSFKFPGAYPHKSNPVVVLWIKISMDLKYKSCQLIFIRFDHPLRCLDTSGTWCNFEKGFQEFQYAKIVQSASEK